MPDVVVSLYDAANAVIGTTTTLAPGRRRASATAAVTSSAVRASVAGAP